MKNTIIKFLFVMYVAFTGNVCIAQKTTADQVKTVLTADSLKSGNAKDILTSFFQLAFNNLTGKNKELNFNSNPFAIMLKSDPNLALDYNYYKYRALRKTNFNFGIKLDSSYKFNGFSSGIKYALIDKRDSSTSRWLFENLRNDSLGIETDKIQHELIHNYAMKIADKNKRKEFVLHVNEFFNSEIPFNKLDKPVQDAVTAIVDGDKDSYPLIWNMVNKNNSHNIFSEQRKVYTKLRNRIKNDLLWTVSVSDTTYKDQFFFSNILLKTELLQGIDKYKPGSNWEFNIQAAINLIDDTLSKGRDLKRMILNFEPGINWVVRNKNNEQSFLEFKFSGSYNHNFATLYAKEKRDSLTFNGTLRVRIINDIWIPLEIKYDPKSGNVFGFLNVRANFTSLGKFAKDLIN